MPKVTIFYRRDTMRVVPLTPDAELEVGMLSTKIDNAMVKVIIDRMQGRKAWDASTFIMEAQLMPTITRNRKEVEVEIVATDGEHWHDDNGGKDTFVEDTQILLNAALLSVLVSEGLVAEGWKGSVWLLTPSGSYGDTDQAAQRLADNPHTLPLPL